VNTSPAPPRSLGLIACLALVVGNMIGSGVFLLPANLAPYGWSATGGWIITISGTMCLAGCFALLSRAFPQAGGPYVYVEQAFGRPAAFVVAWSYWIGLWVGNGALAVAAMSNLSALVPAIGTVPGLGAALAVGVVALFTATNLLGARTGGLIAQITTALKLLPLIAVLVIAVVLLARDGQTAVVGPDFRMESSGVITSVTLTLWAMLGFESATLPADKVRDPARTIPRATLWGTGLTGLIYMAISTAMLALVPAGSLAQSSAPFADFVRPFVGDGAASLVALFATIAALGAMNGWVMVVGEVPRAMAAGGVFPAIFARVNSRGVPVAGLLIASLLTGALVLTNYARSLVSLFQFILLISTIAMLVAYLGVALSLLRLRGQQAGLTGGAGMVALGVASAAYAGFAIYAAGQEAVGWGALMLLGSVPVLAIMRRRRQWTS
jgi:APA family basic amino acid/polyamine antiporter